MSSMKNDPKIEFKNVYLRYSKAGDYSLEDISFKVYPGQTVGIIGSTGSGKSSLVSLIPLFYPATKGEILVDGRNVNAYDKEELREKIGFCFQTYYLFRGTIRDNVVFGCEEATDTEIEEALRLSQSYDFVMSKPKGLDTEVSEKGTNLSGGQKQRLMIARAVVSKPEILILDDAASALDFATEKRLRDGLKKLTDTTLFIVSQRTSSIKHADMIICLDDGRIAAIGTHDELLQNSEVYRQIHESQTDEK